MAEGSNVTNALIGESDDAVYRVQQSPEYRRILALQSEFEARIQATFINDEYELYEERQTELKEMICDAAFKAGMRSMARIYAFAEAIRDENPDFGGAL